MSVNIVMVTPGQNNVKVEWNSSPMPLNSAILYVAANQADLNTPNGMSTPADQSAILPANPLTATQNGLASGTNYFCMCSSDGNFSAVQSFTSTGPAPAPVAHLQTAHPNHELAVGETVRLGAHVLSITNPAPLSGINVNFAVSSGQACGNLLQTSAVSNVEGKAKVEYTGAQVGQAKVVVSSPQADNQLVLNIKVKN